MEAARIQAAAVAVPIQVAAVAARIPVAVVAAVPTQAAAVAGHTIPVAAVHMAAVAVRHPAMAASPEEAAAHMAAAASPVAAAVHTAARAPAPRVQAVQHTAGKAQAPRAADPDTVLLRQGRAALRLVQVAPAPLTAVARYVPAAQAVQAASRHPMRFPEPLRGQAPQAAQPAVRMQTSAPAHQSPADLRQVLRHAASVAETIPVRCALATTGVRTTVWLPATAGLSHMTVPTDAGVAAITASAIA